MQYGLGLICNRSIHAMGIWWRLLMGQEPLLQTPDFTCRDSRIDPYVYPLIHCGRAKPAPFLIISSFRIVFQFSIEYSKLTLNFRAKNCTFSIISLLEFPKVPSPLDIYFSSLFDKIDVQSWSIVLNGNSSGTNLFSR